MPKIEPIARRSLHAELLERIRCLISEGVLAPGSKLIEKELCESFSVSRTPLREAIRALAAEGLVVLTPNRGASVATISQEQILNSFTVMAALEGLAGELAAPRFTDAELAQVRALHDAMLQCREDSNLDGYYSYNRQIHDAIFEAADNDILSDMRKLVLVRIVNLRFVARIGEAEWDAAIEEHEEILSALTARNGAQLGAILRRHLTSKRLQVANWLERQTHHEGPIQNEK